MKGIFVKWRLGRGGGLVAEFKASAADYRQTVLQALGQVADVLQALRRDAQLLAAQQHAVDLATESVRLQRIRYTGGGTGIPSFAVLHVEFSF